MSLQVWLPFNGNINNLGLAYNTKIISKDITYEDGKIGKAANFNSSYIGIDNTPLTGNIKDFSLCFWMKANSVSSTMCLYSGRNTQGGAISLFVIGRVFRFDDGSQHTLSYTVPTNKWEHYCLTRNASEVKLYVNGELKATDTSTEFSITATKATIGTSSSNTLSGSVNYFSGLLNDYRIYDHCLSEKEIKEISKGLLLHYKLNSYCNNNLARQTTDGWNLAIQTGGKTYEWDPVNKIQKITRDSVAYSGWRYLGYKDINPLEIKTNTTYTVSFDMKTSESGKMTFSGLFSGDAKNRMNDDKDTKTIEGGLFTPGVWVHCVYQVTTSENFDGILVKSQILYFYPDISLISSPGSTIELKNLKFEEGDEETPQYPSDFKIYNDIEYDRSGFKNNGTKNGSFTFSKDSPRYSNAINFTNLSYIEHPALPPFTEATYSFWLKPDNKGAYAMVYGNQNAQPSKDMPWLSYNTEGYNLWAYIEGAYIFGDLGKTLDRNWHHACLTWDNGVAQWYLDGKAIGTKKTLTTTTIQNKALGSIGNNQTRTHWDTSFGGSLSDFRIYATALTPDDILQLYQTSALIDDYGNNYSYEFIEEG